MHSSCDPYSVLFNLNDLPGALSTRFRQLGQREDLDEAVSLYQDALEMWPLPIPTQSNPLNKLANVLYMRFRKSTSCGPLNAPRTEIRLSRTARLKHIGMFVVFHGVTRIMSGLSIYSESGEGGATRGGMNII